MAGNVLDDLTTRLKSFGDVLESGFTNTVSFTNKIVKPRTDFQRPSPSASPEPKISTRVHRDREAAAARAELILQQLYNGYYSQTFDPVEYELSQMQDDSKQDDIDAVVERLTAAVEVGCWTVVAAVMFTQQAVTAAAANLCSMLLPPMMHQAEIHQLNPCRHLGATHLLHVAAQPHPTCCCAPATAQYACRGAAGGQRETGQTRGQEPRQAD